MVRDRARSAAGYPQLREEGVVKSTRSGARRLDLIPPYLFAEIDRKVQAKKKAGVDVISLGIGDPDLPTPGRIVSVLQEAASDPSNHRYPSYFGLSELREAISRWYRERSGVELDPDTEILPTLGSKDGISHVPLALVEIPGAKEIGLEFHSLSKTYNMTGWRIGWVCGRADLVNLIGQLKTNIDSGVFQAVQWAAIEAMNGGEEETRAACAVYARRHRLVADTLNKLGWNIKPPRATFYVWAPVPDGYDSIGFAGHVLDEVGVNITPGVGFGPHGEGYFRLSVTAPDARLAEAMTRMGKLKL